MSKTCAVPKSKFPLNFKVTSPVHALELARKLILPFEHWTTGDLAIGSEGSVSAKSPRAEAFCALGALKRVNTEHQKAAQRFLQRAARKLNAWEHGGTPCNSDIFRVNDRGRIAETHKRVLEMFAIAIRLAKKA